MPLYLFRTFSSLNAKYHRTHSLDIASQLTCRVARQQKLVAWMFLCWSVGGCTVCINHRLNMKDTRWRYRVDIASLLFLLKMFFVFLYPIGLRIYKIEKKVTAGGLAILRDIGFVCGKAVVFEKAT